MCEITRHGEKRTRKRMGVNKRSILTITDKYLERGMDSKQTTGKLRRYLDNVQTNGVANKVIVYNNHIMLFDNKTLITTLNLPSKYHKYIKNIKGE